MTIWQSAYRGYMKTVHQRKLKLHHMAHDYLMSRILSIHGKPFTGGKWNFTMSNITIWFHTQWAYIENFQRVICTHLSQNMQIHETQFIWMGCGQNCCVNHVITTIVMMEIIPIVIYFMKDGVTVQGNRMPGKLLWVAWREILTKVDRGVLSSQTIIALNKKKLKE